MSDDLHIKHEDLIVTHNGKSVKLNKMLIDRQQCYENLEDIKALHKKRLILEECMRKTDDVDVLKGMNKAYDEIEFELQDKWKFGRNSKFHRWWYRPKCVCPKIDNDDMYPTGMYTVNQSCPLHGN